MNKKLFKSALFAAAAFVSSIASAQITYDNSVTDNGYVQGANAVVGAGGPSVVANTLVVRAGKPAVGSDIPADAKIIVRLPDGLNFDGEPSYLVSPAVATQGLTLADTTTSGDPTLDDPAIKLDDTNGDGMPDRAEVTAAAAAKVGDYLFITANIKANAYVKPGVQKAEIIVNGGLAVQEIATVLASVDEPVQGSSGTALTTVSQKANANVGVSTASFVITIPKGTVGGKTITLTPESKVTWGSAGSTATVTVHSPVKTNPVKSLTAIGAAGATSSITFTTAGSAKVGSKNDVQIAISINYAGTSKGGTVGLRGLTVGGTAGIKGSVDLFDVKANGSEAKVITSKTNKVIDIVKGSKAEQTLPAITVTENFSGDAVLAAASNTITVTAGAGLTFGSTASVTVKLPWVATAALSNSSATAKNDVLTLTFSAIGVPGTQTFTISGIKATASATASGDLSVKVGSPGKVKTDSSFGPGNSVVVAKAVDVGTVKVTGPKKLKSTGPGGAKATQTVTLEETTYGALTIANKTDIQDAFFRITPSSNAAITSIAVTAKGYPASSAPDFSNNPICKPETGVKTGAFICEVESESLAIKPTTSTISLAIDYQAKKTASVGEVVSVSFDGNAGVSATDIQLANVGLSTKATSGVIPDLEPGDVDSQKLSVLTIKENFAGAITNGSFRVIAPAGVSFNNATVIKASIPVTALSPTGGVTIGSAGGQANNVLVVDIQATSTISVTPQIILGADVSGDVVFQIADGDINGANKANITAESIRLAYADGTLGAVDAGENGDVNVGFNLTNNVSGGLLDYTVKSSDATIAAADISGSEVKVTGKSAGVATITVTDDLGQTGTYVVTVSVGGDQPAAEKVVGAGDASFSAGVSADGGDTFSDEFTAGDNVSMVATIDIDPIHQGLDGALHAAILSQPTDGATSLTYLAEDGTYVPFDLAKELPGAFETAEPLGASYSVEVFSGEVQAGKYRVALAYTATDADGKLILVYAPKAIIIEVAEAP